MKELCFKLKGRRAYLQSMKYADKLKDILSYSHPGARFIPTYNTRDAEGNRLWNGRVSMLKNYAMSTGLLIGAYKELKDAGFKARITKWKNRPKVELTSKGFWEKSESYAFQNLACQKVLDSLSKGGGTVLSATGTGKTKLSAQVFSHIKGRCLFVVDQLNLLHQSQKELSSWLKEPVGIIGGGLFDVRRVTVATIQTLSAHRLKSHFKKFAKGIDVVFIDELHKQMAKRNFGVLTAIKPQAVIGLTATLQMKKKMIRWKVYSISGPVIFEFPLKEGIEAGVLSKVAVVQTTVPYIKNRKLYKEYKKAAREWVVTDIENSNPFEKQEEGYWRQHPVDPYNQYVVCNKNVTHNLIPALIEEGLNAGLAIVVLADRIAHVKLIARRLRHRNPKVLRGATDESQRVSTIKRFEAGKSDLIVASRIFTKGVNIKRISLIIDAAELPSKDDAMQKLGRGARLHEDKNGLIHIDICTLPENKKAGSKRRNAFKKARVPVEVLDASEVSARRIIRCAKKMLNA